MTGQVIETVTFELAEGVSAEAFLSTNRALETFLDECPGFLARRLSKGEDGTWLDYVEWRDMETATAASEAFMQRDDLKPLLESIRPDSVKMTHRVLALAKG